MFALFHTYLFLFETANRQKISLYIRLAEDDKDGVMAEKVLKLFWSLAHSQDVTIEIMDQVSIYRYLQYYPSEPIFWIFFPLYRIQP
jgi:hypothetical protein